jgi:hypothetical protein
MKKKLAIACIGGLMATGSLAWVASADPGGEPNENACHGQLTSSAVQLLSPGGGRIQQLLADALGVKVGELHKIAKELCA